MKYLRKFNESEQPIKGKDLQETIDEILDNLSRKEELSKSENEFLIAASNDKVKSITQPQTTGNFWADMANPHNIGIMWQGEDGVWKRLMSLEDEEDEALDDIDDADEKYYRQRNLEIERAFKNNPGLKQDLEELLELQLKVNKKCEEINKKYKKDSSDAQSHHFNQKLDYATNGTLQSLINQFGDEDENGNYYIGNEPIQK